MKTKLPYLLFLLLTSLISSAQTSNDLFKTPGAKVIWLGIDYSHVKLIGSISENPKLTVDEIKETYFPAWNKLILDEKRKYDIRNIFRSLSVQFKTEVITQINETSIAEDMADNETPNYTKAEIEEFLNSYNFQLKGIGLLLIAESLDQTQETGIYHFVAINLNDQNKILLYGKFSGKTGGDGFRNYWARTFFNVIIELTEKQYGIWKRNPDSRIKNEN